MFTGIVETIGVIQEVRHADDCVHYVIAPHIPFDDLAIGDSISVNGVCLTVTALTKQTFAATAVPQTLRVTNLGLLAAQGLVNLERALKFNARLGGHYVQGHVDGIGEIISIDHDGDAAWSVAITFPTTLKKYIVSKGYITIDGMSITVVDVDHLTFKVTMIPHTQAATIVQHYRIGAKINLEVDIISKYVEKLLRVETI